METIAKIRAEIERRQKENYKQEGSFAAGRVVEDADILSFLSTLESNEPTLTWGDVQLLDTFILELAREEREGKDWGESEEFYTEVLRRYNDFTKRTTLEEEPMDIRINTPTYSPISTEPGKDGSSEKPNNHLEQIVCPKCGAIQTANVEHTVPFYSYVHTCEKCGYTILESEWNNF